MQGDTRAPVMLQGAGRSGRLLFGRAGPSRRTPVVEAMTASDDVDLVGQVRHFLREQGEGHPVPILGGFVARAQPGGRVHVSWCLPGLAVLGSLLRSRHLRRYERLLRSWGLTTELHLEGPEPHVACWVAGPLSGAGQAPLAAAVAHLSLLAP
jgi:hypothetical protein